MQVQPTGMVFDLQHFSIQDGAGIRTTVFLKGCPLRCIWCHNPESWSKKVQLFYYAERCTQCGRCIKNCPNGVHQLRDGVHLLQRDICTHCGLCTESCPTHALALVGQEKSVKEVMDDIMADVAFYEESGGGITISGGEPLAQPEFTAELLKQAKKANLHTCIETSAYGKREAVESILPFVDLLYIDIKETEPTRHKEYTGVSNVKILENLRYMDDAGIPIVLRCPLIPQKNDRYDHYKAIAALANSLKNIQEIHIMPYHPLGISKQKALQLESCYENATFAEHDLVKDALAGIQEHTKIPVKVSN